MKTTSTYATQKHLNWLKTKDSHIGETVLKKKISNQEIIIIQAGNEVLGLLRFGFFWDTIPFMNMLFVVSSIGTRAQEQSW